MMAAMSRFRPSKERGLGRAPRAVARAMVMAAAVTAGCGGGSSSGGEAPSSPSTRITDRATTLAPSAFGPAVLLGEIVDETVTESSGLVASRRNPGRLWTHNDSDTPPLLSCVEPDGGSCGTWTVDGAANVDWEDIAAGPGPQPGEHYLYVGDIGDNIRSRDEVVVYRVVEPAVSDPDVAGTTAATGAATALRLRYDDGAHDAESLMVHPTNGDLYVVTKELGNTGVYRAPPGGGALTRIATLGIGPFGLVTGADISPDGRRVALCTLVGGFELTLKAGAGFDAIWALAPTALTLPYRAQGEAIAYRLDGDALFLTSEGYPSPLFEVPRI